MQFDCLEQLAGVYSGQLLIERVDIDALPEKARLFGVYDVPTLVLRRGGATLERITGAQPCEQLAALFDYYLSAQTQEGN
jgi:thioredoxin-like negative regulator of GroEL